MDNDIKEENKKTLMTVTGPDRPGITSSLTQILARSDVALLDIEQVVVQSQLTLCLLIDIDVQCEKSEVLVKDLLFEARKLGQEISFKEIDGYSKKKNGTPKIHYALTALGEPICADAIHLMSTIVASHEGNIDSIRRLSGLGLSSLEVSMTLPKVHGLADGLKEELLQKMAEHGVDIALQRETLTRRNKRLVALDMDSTLIQVEVIDELARIHGVYDEVAQITKEAMNGGFDFTESLKRRVKLLKGLDSKNLYELADRLPLTKGANNLIKVLKGLGYKVGIISGGFSIAADRLRDNLGLDFAYANRLEVEDGKLTGRVVMPVVDAEKKADLLEWVAHKEHIPVEQTVAIGDGANDALMLAQAGLGIAYHAKGALKKCAHTSVSNGGLEKILYLLGMKATEVEEFLASEV